MTNRKRIAVLSILITLSLVTACSVKLYEPTQNDVAYAQKRWNDEDMARLQRGKNYYATNCNTDCHGLKNPSKFTESDWNDIMPKMAKKAKIADSTSNLILKYVLTAANGMKNKK